MDSIVKIRPLLLAAWRRQVGDPDDQVEQRPREGRLWAFERCPRIGASSQFMKA